MELSANWKKLKATLSSEAPKKPPSKQSDTRTRSLKRKRLPASISRPAKRVKVERPKMDVGLAAEEINAGLSESVEIGKYVAIDCEMVGVGPNPDRESALARVSIVNYNGEQVYDSYVRPKELVTDWRTPVSGVSPKEMEEARSLEQVQADISKILSGNILVGHAIRHDLDALLLGHPRRDIRDTARHPPFRKFAGGGSPKLKILAAEILGVEIQSGAHSSVQDARATMLLFRKEKEGFDMEHAKKWPTQGTSGASNNSRRSKQKKKKKR